MIEQRPTYRIFKRAEGLVCNPVFFGKVFKSIDFYIPVIITDEERRYVDKVKTTLPIHGHQIRRLFDGYSDNTNAIEEHK